MTKEEFIGYIGQIASRDWQARGICLPSVVVAQAILESGWGLSELATKANALFGIKKNGWTGETYTKAAAEQRPDGSYYLVNDTEWRAYEDWEQSIVDHNDYLATREKAKGVLRYKDIIGNSDYKAVCQLLKDCGYATSLDYPQKLISLIETYELTKFDKVVNNVAKIIAIDAGHGRNTAGKRVTLKGYPDTREWTLNDRIADKLEQMLSNYECKVVRVDDTTGANDISLANRVGKANSAKADTSGQVSAETYAAISMAMHLYKIDNEAHDFEDTILTINKVSRTYSPWSSKIYTLRETPQLRK